MKAVVFYIIYPLLYLIASLPFRGLYFLSDMLYPLFYLSGYRKKVVRQNLRNSFPEKTHQEITTMTRAYYRYLCDLVLETLKTLKMTREESQERCIFHPTDFLSKFQATNQSFIIVMGHYGNWEWAGPSFSINTDFQLVVVYRPLSDPYFEKMMTGMRTKFGTRISPGNRVLRDMVASRANGELTATAFIADQTAFRENAYWTTFLNQDTAVFTGPEKLATKFDYPVVFMNVKRIRRGYYEVFPELLIDSSRATTEGKISEAFTKRLEQEIIADPVIWLWSHRRWKYKR